MKHATLLSLILAALTASAAAQMRAPEPMTAAQFASSTAGQAVNVTVRVNRSARTELDCELLDRVNDGLYKGTGKRVELYLAAETPIVMGSMADLKTGAVIYVEGVATTAWHADVKKVVVITPYVKVE